MKLGKIVGCYLVFTLSVLIIFWRFPILAMGRPVFLKPLPAKADYPNIYFLGDCHARNSPWSVSVVSFPALPIEGMTRTLKKNNFLLWRFKPQRIVIFGNLMNIVNGDPPDVIEKKSKDLIHLLKSRYPEADIQFISPHEIHEIAKIHGDGWHLDEKGYRFLAERHPDALASLIESHNPRKPNQVE